MNSKTMTYGMRKAPPPFLKAVDGNRQTLPRPTDIEMQDNRNSMGLPQVSLSGGASCFSYLRNARKMHQFSIN